MHDDFRDITGKHATENKNGQLVEDAKFDKVYDATNGYVEIDEMKWYKDLMGTGNFTVECWATRPVDRQFLMFFGDGTDNRDKTSVGMTTRHDGGTTSGDMGFYFVPPSVDTVNNSITVPESYVEYNNWNHFCVVGIDGVCHFYVNGNYIGNSNANMKNNYNLINETLKLGIGKRPVGFYADKICEFRISNIPRYTQKFTPNDKGWEVD